MSGFDEKQITLIAKMAAQSLLVALSAQMVALQQLAISLVNSGALTPNSAAEFLRRAADVPGQGDDSIFGKILGAPVDFYREQLNTFAAAVEKREYHE